MRSMKQEDVEIPILPPLVDLLLVLQDEKISIFADRETDHLHISPAPPEFLVSSIRAFYPQLWHLLPGVCESCLFWSMKRTDAYWGAHPHVCPECLSLALAVFEEMESWPEANLEDL